VWRPDGQIVGVAHDAREAIGLSGGKGVVEVVLGHGGLLWSRPRHVANGAAYSADGPVRVLISSPASCSPFAELRALLAERGVVSVTGVEPRVIRQFVEDPR